MEISDEFSTWQELLTVVPQGSVLSPLLFKICLKDLFHVLEYTDIYNFAGDTALVLVVPNLNKATMLNMTVHYL